MITEIIIIVYFFQVGVLLVLKCYNALMNNIDRKDKHYNTVDELIKQANKHLFVPFGELDKTGRIHNLKDKGKLGIIVEEAIFDIKSNNRPEPDIPNLKVELKTTPFKRNKNGSISAKERTVLNIIDFNKENLEDFYASHLWDKCSQILFLFYDGTLDDRPILEYYVQKTYFFKWLEEDMPTIIEDFLRITNKIKIGKAETLSESDGNYLSTCTKGQGHGKDMRTQPFSSVLAKQRAWELKPSYMTHILNTQVFNNEDIESILQGRKGVSFQNLILETIKPHIGKTKDALFNEFEIDSKAKHSTSLLIRKMLGIQKELDNSAEFQKANMNLRVINIKHNGMPKEDSPFRCYSFKGILQETWEESQVYTEICEKRFMYVFFRAIDKKDTTYVLDKVLFWGFPEYLIPEANHVWEETRKIIKDGVKLTVNGIKVTTNFPTSKINKVIFTKIHASNTLYEVEPNKFVGKGKLSDTDELPDGRKITKHSFWFPKKFVKKIYEEKI